MFLNGGLSSREGGRGGGGHKKLTTSKHRILDNVCVSIYVCVCVCAETEGLFCCSMYGVAGARSSLPLRTRSSIVNCQ